MDQFFRSFVSESEALAKEYKGRLREVEEEMERERIKQSEKGKEENYKY